MTRRADLDGWAACLDVDNDADAAAALERLIRAAECAAADLAQVLEAVKNAPSDEVGRHVRRAHSAALSTAIELLTLKVRFNRHERGAA